jgi:endoglucanase
MRIKNYHTVMVLTLAAFIVLHLPVQAAQSVTWPDSILRGSNVQGGVTYSEADIAYLAQDWRANIVRVLLNLKLKEDGQWDFSWTTREKALQVIDMCLKNRIYTVVALSPDYSTENEFFNSDVMKKAYIAFWKDIAVRYAGSGPIAYDLMNEPHDELANTQWSAYAQELTDSIRTVDKVHTLVVEPPAWGWPDGFANLKPTTDKNTVYSFHFYGPMDYTHQRYADQMMNTPEVVWRQRAYPGDILGTGYSEYWDKAVMRTYVQKTVNFRKKYGVRLWCGEFGCARWAIGAKQWFTDWIDLLEEYKMDWTLYSYREWHHMDIEMDPLERRDPTARIETELVGLFRKYYARNIVETDFNRDGATDLSDALEMARFQLRHPGSLAADYNRDGRAGVLDLLNLLLRLKTVN